LKQAAAGVYLNRRLADIPGECQQTYCEPHSKSHFHVNETIRERVTFTELNLRDLVVAKMSGMDLIYCQNLLIYYDRPRRMEIVSALSDCLSPVGVMILGPGELLEWQHSNIEKVHYTDTLAYRRID